MKLKQQVLVLLLIPIFTLPLIQILTFIPCFLVSNRFKPYPLRVAMLTTIYGFGLYKWWMYVSS